MKFEDFKNTPFYKGVKYLIKDIGFEEFEKQYPGFIESAKLWLSIEKMRKDIDKLLD